MRIMRAENYRRMRWKNGGGETAEIAVSPEGAGLDDFGWRVSMAKVEAGGPFSAFPGVDRTLSILEGEGIVLDIEGRQPVTLTGASAPYSFAADAATNAELLVGPITDLNVMTRRGRYAHRVTRHDVARKLELTIRTDETILFCSASRLQIGGRGFEEELGPYDALMPPKHPLSVEGHGRLFVIELEKSG
jgi:environmental stress-induced protein Ves